ncbi:MAG TPA: type I restriction enzyme HsdR N-terminal domain-containing protein [Anaerolineales bacterium]|nr:type I restriction enzyme HsdR N-terminal domain-containing protein [Anaerolineales bacterium]
MATIPTKVKDRLAASVKRYVPVLTSAKSRDVNESDTVTIITDMLADIFGFDKYSEITSEFVIRSTYVDLAIRLDGKLQMLIEVKAIGSDLKEGYIKQAVDYAANQGIEWVILTNGATWQVYKVSFGKPIGQDLVLQIDFFTLNTKNQDHLDNLFLLTKEGIGRSVLGEYHTQRQALSRFFIGAIVMSDPILEVIRRELRKMSPDVKIDTAQIKEVLVQEIMKRDVMEGEKAQEEQRKVARAASRAMRQAMRASSTKNTTSNEAESTPEMDNIPVDGLTAGENTAALIN